MRTRHNKVEHEYAFEMEQRPGATQPITHYTANTLTHAFTHRHVRVRVVDEDELGLPAVDAHAHQLLDVVLCNEKGKGSFKSSERSDA